MSEATVIWISVTIGVVVGALTRLLPGEDWDFLSRAGLFVIVFFGGFTGPLVEGIHPFSVSGPLLLKMAAFTVAVCIAYVLVSLKHTAIEGAAIGAGWLAVWLGGRLVRIVDRR